MRLSQFLKFLSFFPRREDVRQYKYNNAAPYASKIESA
jgi:hypothetical protein